MGWNIHQRDWTEYEVEGMPNQSGKGYVDYVLWGDNGKPLALVEAKRTLKDATAGKHQAKLYADCLQQRFGQRPVIFYSNGYNHWMWDDTNYPPREVQGFLKKDELERLIFRRSHRKKLNLVQVDTNIVGRSYQIEAIRRICDVFDSKKGRKSLLVMATGTGKTRTAIALIDLLMRGNWVKRILFLADRNALLTQAYRAFKTHLPNAKAIDLTKSNDDGEDANIILSTYPTISNRINRSDGDKRIFGCGHFDLIIVDEAHRSIYKKYKALFEYFDGLLVGLTATPRNDVHRDTYRLFDLEAGVPTYAYELTDAISDGYLVPPQGVNVPFKFLRKGVKYRDLSPEEQEEYEEKFRDEETGEIPDEINSAALNNWLFNINTADQALKILMEFGIKIDGGDKLGKTIIFARNHNHAKFIVERFDINYPHYKGQFAQVIDSKNDYAQSLLDDFSEPNKQPTIAVSVDMLDTGVDVPEIVNLVFFKPVYSEVKFNQMIGRGTRLCPNLFAIGADKNKFLVFDLCSNFDYFQQEIKENDAKPGESLTTCLVKTRLELATILNQNNSTYQNLRKTLLDDLHNHVNSMERDNFLVRPHLEKVEEFSQRQRWEEINNEDVEIINQSLAKIPNGLPTESHLAKRFDLLCFKLQLAILKPTTLKPAKNFIQLRDRVRDLLQRLEAKHTIPMVKAKLPLITEVQSEDWWTDTNPNAIENIRLQLRDLIRFIDPDEQELVYTDFTDELEDLEEVDIPISQPGFSPYQYRKKVEAYIRNNENHIAIAKLKRNHPLTDADLQALETMLFSGDAIESREQFETVYGKDINFKLFIRKIVGCDRNAAKQAFSKYLTNTNFNANQIRFIENIIDYLTQNGVIPPEILYEPPFTDLHHQGLDGIFKDTDAEQIFEIVNSFNATVDFDVA